MSEMKITFSPREGKAVELLVVVNASLLGFLKGRSAADGLMMWVKKEENRALARFSAHSKTRKRKSTT
ncbi:MAG: hypothetical protein Q7S75_01065 [bacterium]|nr:hypothetical protein [bacterium]